MIVVAIDGPAGSGKSSVARLVAGRLGVPHVDSGAYYRAATLAVQRAGVPLEDTAGVVEVVRRVTIDRVGDRTLLDGQDVEEEIRGESVTAAVSAVSAQQPVRDALLDVQRRGLAAHGGVVEGRDAATRIAPHATLKVWLDADVATRAVRRAEQAGEPERVAFHEADLERRDAADARQMAMHPDAIVVDTAERSLDEVVEHVVALAEAAAGR